MASRTIICPSCGGTGCGDCEGTGVVELDGEHNPRPDGLPWHPHAVEGPTNIVAPKQDIRRRRAPSADPAALARALAEAEAENNRMRAALDAASGSADAERLRQLEAENDRLSARLHENAAPHTESTAETARLGPPNTLLGG